MLKLLKKRKVTLEFLRYTFIGTSGTILDIGLLMLLKDFFGVNPTIAVVISQPIVILYNFNLNRLWTFGKNKLKGRQVFRYTSLIAWNYAIAVLFMYIFNEGLGVDHRVVRIASIMLSVLWNFILYKFWVFAKEK